ncbi:hypothetical protein ACFV7R_03005 [Streptomyces sp. NPDC059866]|uniref:hypothetical protein n=1 Tax=Streptomyces sp. NPDC059866 TaxID=3346978 RepID=UPI00366891D3
MRARGWILGVWAVLCLGGLAATSSLNAEPATEEPEPRETAVDTVVVDCERIADEIERDRIEAHEARQRTGEATIDQRMTAVPEQCADELDERGIRYR